MTKSATIFACATGAGPAGIAVVRISGPHAATALRALGGTTDAPRLARRCRLTDPNDDEVLDDALALWFPGPASFTGEDVAELHVHGGRAVVGAVLGALSSLEGLEPAEPGAFTRRAFANGKLDLTEVEGLADLVAAETDAQRRQALRQLEGTLGTLYEGWRSRLIRLMAHVEAELDFSDEEPEEGLARAQIAGVRELAAEISAHLDDGHRGERLREGFRVVLAGPPNVGKSSLLNALARRDAAIVTPEAGTTRDVIDVALDLSGFPVLVSDTAGLRVSEDMAEREGVRRSLDRMADADLVIWLCDATATSPVMPDLDDFAPDAVGPILIVWNKTDLRPGGDGLAISALSGAGIDTVLDAIGARAADTMNPGAAPVLTRVRHRTGLEDCLASLTRAVSGGDVSPELMGEDLRSAAHALGRLTGRVDVEDLLDVVFADFCIGK